jgi:hypothetical protein
MYEIFTYLQLTNMATEKLLVYKVKEKIHPRTGHEGPEAE